MPNICEFCYLVGRNKAGENCCVKCYYSMPNIDKFIVKEYNRYCVVCAKKLPRGRYYYCDNYRCPKEVLLWSDVGYDVTRFPQVLHEPEYSPPSTWQLEAAVDGGSK